MASFVGTKKEFKRYLGAMLRNLVQQLTKKHKMEIGCCEHCQATNNLEAAHVHGKDRGAIIDKILENYITGNVVTIDLANFEQHFRNEHKIIDETILILCKNCHSKYDSLAYVPNSIGEKNNLPEKISQKSSRPPSKSYFSKNNKRLFSNQEIQYKITSVAQRLPDSELEKLCNSKISKELFNINFPLFIRVSKNISSAEKKNVEKDFKGYSRWTWKYEFEKCDFIYAITTQWYGESDIYVKRWLNNKINSLG